MQALVLNNGLSYRQDVPKPVAGVNEALISLKLAGICATDLELVKGYAGFSGIIGHEFVGVVDAVNHPEHRHWLNRRVVGSINIGCQHCYNCLHEGPEHCQRRTVLGIRGKDGVFADYFTLPVSQLYIVPDEVSDQAAVFTEPLAAALRVVKQLEPLTVTTVAVVGPGRLGLLIAKVLALAGYDIEVLGRSEASLALPRQWQLKTALIEEVADHQFACVIDASGQASGFRQSLRILKPRGTLVLKSTFSSTEPLDLSKIVIYELTVLGSRCGPFADALALLQQQTVPVETLIDGYYHLNEGLTALTHAAQAGVRKILLQG
ncbi:alcohol dehydrogenase catalytic domain-containing protein [Methylicorpusculum oleiharenae]|uniref:alcohol dehydrogenase catalytic domain-containing protein n=1 Tax=Methylicorpusculum oleiharenae TaxID=1338687 RepID=UPI0013585C59|nr:alcohol dehydrogenase catalytic domain-containing protein [Methylicorpusculum oleiharenae]MCD2451448.1 alcohol dehydrogenase catalytic domain-containing protein [Methylicorpusculum oleiharenae]